LRKSFGIINQGPRGGQRLLCLSDKLQKLPSYLGFSNCFGFDFYDVIYFLRMPLKLLAIVASDLCG